MKVYKSKESKNTAYISEVMMHPYYGAPVQRGHQLAIYDSYGFNYHVSCHETQNDALWYLQNRCGGGYEYDKEI